MRLARLGRRAVVAMEFALIAPVLILLAFGVVELAAGIRVQIGVDQAARAVANLIVQQANVTTAELNDFYIAGQDCYSIGTGTFSISATSVVFAAGTGTASVGWDAATVSNQYVAAPSNVASLASSLAATSLGVVKGGDSAIVVQAHATFTVPVPYGPIAPSYTFTSTVYARPRMGFVVTLN
jgi:Flp pilus assembly protein TadG